LFKAFLLFFAEGSNSIFEAKKESTPMMRLPDKNVYRIIIGTQITSRNPLPTGPMI